MPGVTYEPPQIAEIADVTIATLGGGNDSVPDGCDCVRMIPIDIE